MKKIRKLLCKLGFHKYNYSIAMLEEPLMKTYTRGCVYCDKYQKFKPCWEQEKNKLSVSSKPIYKFKDS